MSKRLADITTPWTDIFLAQNSAPKVRAKCLELLAEKYREPIRLFIESALGARNPGQADELVQGYFVKFMKDGFLDRLDQSKGRLRGFFMTTVRSYTYDERDKGEAGASYSAFSKHHGLPSGDNIVDKSALTPDEEFMRNWARQLLNDAIEAFRLACRDHGKQDYYDVFVRHVLDHDALEKPSYEDTAKELGITVKRVENCRANALKNFNKILRDIVRATVANDSQVDEELAELRKCLS